ncbi:hypothetical protein CPB86DRAFT_187518 [Serendipita vermifera]|nr:hypothetical protein CPB86DRAFT_187518 [Serendipita vermifera]
MNPNLLQASKVSFLTKKKTSTSRKTRSRSATPQYDDATYRPSSSNTSTRRNVGTANEVIGKSSRPRRGSVPVKSRTLNTPPTIIEEDVSHLDIDTNQNGNTEQSNLGTLADIASRQEPLTNHSTQLDSSELAGRRPDADAEVHGRGESSTQSQQEYMRTPAYQKGHRDGEKTGYERANTEWKNQKNIEIMAYRSGRQKGEEEAYEKAKTEVGKYLADIRSAEYQRGHEAGEKATYEKAQVEANKYVDDIRNAAYQRGHEAGEKATYEKAQVEANKYVDDIRNAAYQMGHQDGESVGYEKGKTEVQNQASRDEATTGTQGLGHHEGGNAGSTQPTEQQAAEIARMTTLIAELNQSITEKKDRIDSLLSTIRKKNQELLTKATTWNTLAQEFQKVTEARDQSKNALEEQIKINESLVSEAATLRAQGSPPSLASLQEKWRIEANEYKDRIAQLTQQLETQEATARLCKAERDDLQSQCTQLTASLQAEKEKCDQLNQKLDNLKASHPGSATFPRATTVSDTQGSPTINHRPLGREVGFYLCS